MSEIITISGIREKIFTLRDKQVMLDEDIAQLFGVETKRLNEQVKRNIERFPQEFCFQLNENDLENLRSQIATSSWGGRRYQPFAFTEQGVAMLSAVLRSETAVKVSIQIINAFVAMRRFLSANAQVFQRLDSLEIKQIQTDQKIERVLTAIEDKSVLPKQGIFFDGQVFDAYTFACDLIRSARQRIILIDNYVDESVLVLLSKRNPQVSAQILTTAISKQLALDLKKHQQQYPAIDVQRFQLAHDRFLIIDHDIYHIGASLKDLGKKWFAFSKMAMDAIELLAKVKVDG